nr:hypothetical protein [Thioalkalivibrio sp.]
MLPTLMFATICAGGTVMVAMSRLGSIPAAAQHGGTGGSGQSAQEAAARNTVLTIVLAHDRFSGPMDREGTKKRRLTS